MQLLAASFTQRHTPVAVFDMPVGTAAAAGASDCC
jgi:hypothetical protein